MKIFKMLFLSFIFLLNLKAYDLEPNYSLIASGGVTDLVLKNNLLYVATTASSVDIFDINTKIKTTSIKIPQIKDFMQDTIDSKIYSVDVLADNILILSQGEKGGRNIDIYNDGKLERIISDENRLFIARAKFLDENHIIYALLSNQIYLYDIKNKKILNETQISQSKFSNFKLTRDKTKVLISDESGILTMIDTKNFELVKKFEGQNLDNVFQVDIKNEIILTAGQDRKAAIYSLNEKISYYKTFPFLIYSAGLSPSGKLAAVASDEENNVTIFEVDTKKELFKLKQNRATLTNILFINEKELFVTSDHEQINYYKIN
ncbi:WD40 repeat domain-containing protein [Arcobacter cloacae]|uniref:Nitrate reductase accessory protein n=1 Tax=Arcobacter cloacae TaxID=1054034 RepID=A0A4Q0ZGT2_9BACT|nr:WD40 repeat domain-containing protein [Arcobacter cloacae]RXJ85754.1 hypothetical protein CRU90_00390 [Arcobacter cloacae]